MTKKTSKTQIQKVKHLLNGYRLPHGYEIVVRERTSAAGKTRAAIARGEASRKRKPKHGKKRRARDSKGRFK